MEESIVKLRKKVLKNGKSSLYLDFYVNGKREYEFLKIYISNEPKDKAERDDNKRNLAIAQQIRNNREQEIYSGMYGVATNYNTDASFIEFFEDLTVNMNTSDNNRGVWYCALKHLRLFSKGDVTFKQIDENWLNAFKRYLLKKVKQNSAYTYFNKIRAPISKGIDCTTNIVFIFYRACFN
jgi:hypothetical protein